MNLENNNILSKVLFDTINDPILVHPLLEDGYAPFVLLNKAAFELYEYTSEELYQLTIKDIVKEIGVNKVLLKREKKQRFETIHITKSGKEIPVDVSLTIIDNNEEKLILSVVRDITEKKQYEQKLINAVDNAKESSKILEDVINNIPVRIFWKDLNLNYLGGNKLFANDGGLNKPEELIGKNDYELIWKEQAEMYRNDDLSVITSKKSKINYEELQTNVKGTISWLRTSKIPLIDGNSKVKGILGTYEDITSRKTQELTLKNTQKELLHAQEIAHMGNWLFDISNETFKWSDQLFKIFKFPKVEETVLLKSFEKLLFEEEKEFVVGSIKNAIKNKSFLRLTHRIIRLDDKEIRWVSVRGEYIEDENGKHFLKGIVQDITTLKNTQIELEVHKKNLEKLVKEQTKELEFSNKELIVTNKEVTKKNEIINKNNIRLKSTLDKLNETQNKLIHADKMSSLGILTAGISHELNNPLNFIQGGLMGLKTVLEKEVQEREDVNELLGVIDIGIQRASKIITGLNHFNRTNDNYEEVCNIHSILDNVLVMLSSELKHKVNVFKKYYPNEIKVKGNVGKLHQVFVNLLSNASQAITGKGTIEISTEIKENKAVISITDSGKGIAKDELKHVFDPFFTTKEPGKGIGLGLSISYTIIKEHKGTITFQSEKNIGTKAIVTLQN